MKLPKSTKKYDMKDFIQSAKELRETFEPKLIEKLSLYPVMDNMEDSFYRIEDKINELIDAINTLNKHEI